MTTFEAFSIRQLVPADRAEARRLAAEAGVAGVYVLNSLDAPHSDDRAFVMHASGGALVGLAWFGYRGNLLILERQPLDPESIAAALFSSTGRAWRVALGPETIVEALARRERRPALVDRTQVYYASTELPPAEARRHVVRPAVRSDARALVEASLDLSESDLHVPAWRVHRAWLRDSVRRRIRDDRTFVIGEPGDPVCKLDIGSRGPGGVVLEGVHTRHGERGRGFATSLVAAVVADELEGGAPVVCLHVAADNGAARAAYERAGMELRGTCRLMLRG